MANHVSATIRVDGTKESMDLELLGLYFENKKRSGGGDVINIEDHRQDGYVLVSFEDSSVVTEVLQKSHTLDGVTLTVSPWQPSSIVKVMGLISTVSEELLELYFESKKAGSATVVKVQLNAVKGEALVTLSNVDDVMRILEKTHTISGHPVTVSMYTESVSPKTSSDTTALTALVIVGLKPSVSREELLRFFQQESGVDVDHILEIRRDDGRDVTYTLFDDSNYAEKVASSTDTICGCRVHVSVERPPKIMNNRIALRGLLVSVTSSDLKNFVEGSTNLEVKNVLFSDDKETAVVVFGKDISFAEVKRAITKKKLKGQILSVETVPVSNTVLVQFQENHRPTEDCVRLYFESKQGSGSKTVKKVAIMGNGEYALVTFSDTEVAEVVAGRQHTIERRNVEVSLYTECLGIKHTSKPPPVRMIEPVLIPSSAQRKVSLLETIPAMHESLHKALKERHVSLTLPDISGRFYLTCSQTVGSDEYLHQANTFAVEAERALQEHLQKVFVEEVNFSADEYKETQSSFTSLDDGPSVYIKHDIKTGTVYLVWDKDENTNIAMKIKSTLSALQQSLRRKALEKSRDVPINSSGRIKLLKKQKIEKDAIAKYPKLCVQYDLDRRCLALKGLEEEIQEMELLVKQALEKITPCICLLDYNNVGELLLKPKVKDYLEALCSSEYFSCVLEVTETGFEVFTLDEQKGRELLTKCRNAVKVQRIPLTDEFAKNHTSPEWEELKKHTQEHNDERMLIVQSPTELTIMSVNAPYPNDIDNLKEFLQTKEQTISFSMEELIWQLFHVFIKEQCDGECSAEFDDVASRVVLTSKKVGKLRLQEIKQKFERELICETKTYTEPCISDYFDAQDWQLKSKEIQYKFECKILNAKNCPSRILARCQESDLSFGQTRVPAVIDKNAISAPSTLPTPIQTDNNLQLQSSSKKRESLPVKPSIDIKITSDITTEKHDVLVNSTNTSLNMESGRVSKALLESGGPIIQESLQRKYPHGIKVGEIASSKAGMLQCKQIFHCCLPEESDPTEIMKVVIEAVRKCLEKAEKKKFHTIGIPALGTGNLKYPPGLVAEAMYEATITYSRTHPKTRISHVTFIIQDRNENVVRAFQAEEEKHKEPAESCNDSSQAISVPEKTKPTEHYLFFEDCKQSVTMVFIAIKRQSVQKAMEELMKNYMDSIISVEHDVPSLSLWDKHHITLARNACSTANIDVTFNYKLGHVTLRGLQHTLSKFPFDKSIKEGEQSAHDMQNIDSISKQVKWCKIIVNNTGEEFQPYDATVNYKIEREYKNGNASATISDPDPTKSITIDFSKMQEILEFPGGTNDSPVRVIRRSLIDGKTEFSQNTSNVTFPQNWKPNPTGICVDVVPVQKDSEEYKKIAKTFMDSYKCPTTQIKKIERIQNETLYKQYKAFEISIKNQMPPNRSCELENLWHATIEDDAPGIIYNGFNRSLGDLTRNVYGEGVHFAKSAADPSTNRYAKPNGAGEQLIFLCRVLIGESTRGMANMRTLPEIPTNKGCYYNSAVDNVKKPTMFVAFHDAQAYPDYLITFVNTKAGTLREKKK